MVGNSSSVGKISNFLSAEANTGGISQLYLEQLSWLMKSMCYS